MNFMSMQKSLFLLVLPACMLLSCVSTPSKVGDASVIDTDPMRLAQRRQLVDLLQTQIAQETPNMHLVAKYHLAIIALGQEESIRFRQSTIESIRAINSILADVHYIVISLPEKGYVGQEYQEPLIIQVMSADLPLTNLVINVQELVQQANGVTNSTKYTMKTDRQGIARVYLGAPQAVGVHRIIIGIDTDSFLEPRLADEMHKVNLLLDEEIRSGFENLIDNNDVLVRIAVDSFAIQHTIDFYVEDTDVSGAIIEGENTAVGIVQALSEAGFNAAVLSPPESTERITLGEAFALSTADRVAFGEVKILQFEESIGGFSVELGATVRTYDRTEGKELLVIRKTQRSSGTNSSSTVVAAFRILGTKIAEELQRGLP